MRSKGKSRRCWAALPVHDLAAVKGVDVHAGGGASWRCPVGLRLSGKILQPGRAGSGTAQACWAGRLARSAADPAAALPAAMRAGQLAAHCAGCCAAASCSSTHSTRCASQWHQQGGAAPCMLHCTHHGADEVHGDVEQRDAQPGASADLAVRMRARCEAHECVCVHTCGEGRGRPGVCVCVCGGGGGGRARRRQRGRIRGRGERKQPSESLCPFLSLGSLPAPSARSAAAASRSMTQHPVPHRRQQQRQGDGQALPVGEHGIQQRVGSGVVPLTVALHPGRQAYRTLSGRRTAH